MVLIEYLLNGGQKMQNRKETFYAKIIKSGNSNMVTIPEKLMIGAELETGMIVRVSLLKTKGSK